MKLNSNTSLEPHFYEAAQELVDDSHHSTGSTRTIYRSRLDGMLTALHALTGDIWTMEALLVNGRDVICIQNEAGDERVVPSHIDYEEGVFAP